MSSRSIRPQTPVDDRRHPPFTPGNDLAVTHGGESPALLAPRVAELVDEAIAAVPYLRTPDFLPAVKAWARAEAGVERVGAWLDVHGMLDENGQPRPAVTTLLRLERLATTHRKRLGLDPTSRAALQRELASSRGDFDVETLLAEGREALTKREAAR